MTAAMRASPRMTAASATKAMLEHRGILALRRVADGLRVDDELLGLIQPACHRRPAPAELRYVPPEQGRTEPVCEHGKCLDLQVDCRITLLEQGDRAEAPSE